MSPWKRLSGTRFSHALICTRYLDGKCEPHATEAAKDLVRAFRSHLRRCERKGLPIMEAEPLRAPYVPSAEPHPVIYWCRGAYTTYGRDRPFGWSEQQPQHEWRISKKKGGGPQASSLPQRRIDRRLSESGRSRGSRRSSGRCLTTHTRGQASCLTTHPPTNQYRRH